MSNHHGLKCFSDNFQPIVDGHKKATVRFNDRNYQVGDTITFKEGQNEVHGYDFTGREISARISHIDDFGLMEGFVCLSLTDVGLMVVE